MPTRLNKRKKNRFLIYFVAALKYAPHAGHLNRPIVSAFLPFGASFHVFVGVATSLPHFGHFAIISHLFMILDDHGVHDVKKDYGENFPLKRLYT